MTLTALADRVQALTSACRETDARIDCYLRGWTFVAYEKQFSGHVYHWRKGGVGSQEAMVNVQPFTASLDAAMTLVPEGLPILIRDGYDDAPGDKRPYAHVMNEIGEGYAATKTLAIVVAALRAPCRIGEQSWVGWNARLVFNKGRRQELPAII